MVAEVAGFEEGLGVAKLGEEAEPGEQAQLALLGRLVRVNVLGQRDGVGVVIALKASEEDLDKVAAVLLSEVGNGAEEGEKLSFVALDDESLWCDLSLRVTAQTVSTRSAG